MAFDRTDAKRIIEALQLEPLPVEGGLFRQTWRSDSGDAVVGTATYAAFTDDPDCFSAMHKLTIDEVWHFYLGDPIELLILRATGEIERPTMGPSVLDGQRPQLIVKAGDWMGGRLAPGGVFALFGNTMAPGFHSACYTGGEAEALAADWPAAADDIRALTRPGAELHMPDGL
ncbi:MAG: cupin domain-containing protein [Pseudomonadota bacterium]